VTPDTRAQLGDQGPAGGSGPRELLPYRSAQGRWVLAAMILGSSVTGIDSIVVVVALPMIGRNLHAGFQALQWTVTVYTLTMAALLLLAGSLSDRWGRRRVFLAGLGWFTLASGAVRGRARHRRLIAALAAATYAIIVLPGGGIRSSGFAAAAVLAVASSAAFIVIERCGSHPMLPPAIFRPARFRAANAVTFVVNGALGGFAFVFIPALEIVAGYSPVVAGSALVPITVVTLLRPAASGQLAQRIGPGRQ
jgi:MFS family permease